MTGRRSSTETTPGGNKAVATTPSRRVLARGVARARDVVEAIRRAAGPVGATP